MRAEADEDPAIEELAAARDSDELCRLLVRSQRRQLARRALRSGIARVRRAALDRLCELDGPEAALRRAAADADRTVRAWRPPGGPEPAQSPLPGMHLDGEPGVRRLGGSGR
jgi:hypothetical protein